MSEQIQDIFSESAEFGTEIFSHSKDGNYNLNGRPLMEGSITGRISTLSEVFVEWYLFDSSVEKNIETFLQNEDLTDVFTESEFMDLMCGYAFVDNKLLELITLKLPYRLDTNKLKHLNFSLPGTNPSAHLITSNETTDEKIKNLSQLKSQQQKDHQRQYRETHREHISQRKHKYYKENREKIYEKQKIYIQKHLAELKEYQAKYRAEHAAELKEYFKQYRKKNAVVVSERKKKCYNAKKEQYLRKNKENYKKNKERHLSKCKEYYEKNKEQYLSKCKEYYEKNKEHHLAQSKIYNQKLKQKAEVAKTVCAAYVFLLNLRKTNKELYLQLYTKRQEPLTGMLKTCVALQNMDINMCPLCNENCEHLLEKCCNQKVLAIPNVLQELHAIAEQLKQR